MSAVSRDAALTLSEGYRIPGHRLGCITAAPELLQHIATVCDCMQICPPRAPQMALAPIMPSLRDDLAEAAAALENRLEIFTDAVASVPGWRVVSSGGFYAYVEFPEGYAAAATNPKADKAAIAELALGGKVGSEDVGRALATLCGVLTLPGCFFMPALDDPVWAHIQDGDAVRADRWVRFAVANVSDDTVKALAPRLQQLNDIMGV